MSEVYQQREFKICRFQIIHRLRPMFVGEFGNGFEFDDYFTETNEVRLVD
jgi:hypothetical protein